MGVGRSFPEVYPTAKVKPGRLLTLPMASETGTASPGATAVGTHTLICINPTKPGAAA